MHSFDLKGPRAIVLALVVALGLVAGCGENADAMLASAKNYLAKNEPRSAIIQLKNALQKNPNLAEARYLLGKTLLDSGDPTSAEIELRKAVDAGYSKDKAEPQVARAMIEEGEFSKALKEFGNMKMESPQGKADLAAYMGFAQLGLGRIDDAKTSFATALHDLPDHAIAQLGQARIKVLEKDLPGAEKIVDGVLVKNPQMMEALAFKSQLLGLQGKLQEAAQVDKTMLKLRPNSVNVRFNLVGSLIRSGKVDQAETELGEMKKVAPKDPHTLYLEALMAYRKKDLQAAHDAILEVLKTSPNHLPSLLLAGTVEYERGNYTQAEPYLRKVLDRLPNQVFARRLLTMVYIKTGRASRAVDTIKPALQVAPNDPDVLLVAGEAYLYDNNMEEASKYYEKAAAVDQGSALVRTRLGLSQLALGDTNAGIRQLEAASELDPKHIQADVALLIARLRQGKLDKAMDVVKTLEKKQPNNPVTYNLKAAVLLAKGDEAGARASLEQAVKLDPKYFPAILNLAKMDARRKDFAAAAKRFTDLLKLDPNNSQALLALAQLRSDTGAPQQDVLKPVQQAVTGNPQALGPRIALIRLYLHYKEPQQALGAAQDAQAAIPNNPQIVDLLGQAELAQGDTNSAAATFNQLAALAPHSVVPYMRLAQMQVAAKDYDSAAKSLDKAASVQPGNPDVLRAQVALAVATKHYDEGLNVARNAEHLLPKSPLGPLLEGDVYGAQNKWAEAAGVFRNALKRFPSDEFAIRLNDALIRSGKKAEAQQVADDWLKAHPTDVAMHVFLGQQALQAKNYGTAIKHYKAVLQVQPQNFVVLNNLAWTASQVNDPKAIEYAQQAFKLQPNNPAVMDTLAMLLTKQGEAAKGVDLLKKALVTAPNAATIRLDLAKALIASGDKAQAKKELQTLLDLGDKFAGRQEAAELMKTL